MTQVRVVSIEEGRRERTCICLLCVPSIRIKKSALESSVCLPASLSAAPLLACLGKRNKQGRREAGQGNSSSASLSPIFPLSPSCLPPPPRHFVNSTFQQFRIHPNSLPSSEKSPQSAKTLSFLIQINPFDSSSPSQSESFSKPKPQSTRFLECLVCIPCLSFVSPLLNE